MLTLLFIFYFLNSFATFVVLTGFHLVLSSATYFSIVSFCLTFCVCDLLSAGCRIIVPLASGVCSLLGKVYPGACVGFLMGGTGACPLVVELGLVPLVGRAVSRGVF